MTRQSSDPVKAPAVDPAVRAKLSDNILVLSNYYYPEPTGSAPPISDLSFWLAEQDLLPSVLSARPSYPRNAVYPEYSEGQHDREELNGVRVRRVASLVTKSRGAIGRLISETSFAVSAVAALRRRYAGVICVCPSVFVVLVAPLFRKRGGKVVAIVHDIQSGLAAGLKFGAMGKVTGVLRWLEAWSLNRCDRVIALSPAMEKELRDLGVRVPIIVIPPQVDVREIEPLELDEAAPIKIVYSGNLGRKQGLDQVLDLAAELQKRQFSGRIIIRGEGSERADLERKAAEAALANVSFLDLAPRSEISLALGEAMIHLIPQSASGANFALPSKIFSVMAARRPYVATAAAESPLAIVTQESGAGICVEPDRPDLFADAIEMLAADAGLRERLGSEGRSFAERVMDREVICRKILETIT